MSGEGVFDWLIEFIALCGLTVRTITAGTTASCLVMTLVVLSLQRMAFREQEWAKYFGYAYLTLTIQYLVRWLDLSGWALGLKNTWWFALHATSLFLERLVALLGSSINNLFFLATALALLLGTSDRKKLFPPLAIAAAIITTILRDESYSPWHRFPDAIFSLFCLGLVGWALFTRISPRRRRALSVLALAGGLAYGILTIVYASVPVSNEIIPRAFSEKLERRIAPLAEALGTPVITPAAAYDATLFAMALLLKLFLFCGAMFLLLRTIFMLHPKPFREVLNNIADGKVEYLHGDGIIKAIGQSLDADLAEVCLLLPGTQAESVVWWRWFSGRLPKKPPFLRFEVTPLPGSTESVVGKVLATNEPVKCKNTQVLRARKEYLEKAPGMKSLLAVPIRYQGATIGCLNLEWKDVAAYTDTAFQIMQYRATFLAPTAQVRRETAAFEQCSQRLPTLKLTLGPDDASEPDHPSRPFPGHETASALEGAVEIIHDILSPHATGISLNLGFRPRWVVRGDAAEGSRNLETNCERPAPRQLNNFAEELKVRFTTPDEDSQDRNGSPFQKVPLQVDDVRVGTLTLVPHHQINAVAPHRRPMLAPLQPISHLVTVAILDAIGSGYLACLNKLQLRLSSARVQSAEEWFNITEDAVRSVGLLWMVTKIPGKKGRLGKAAAVIIVETIENEEVPPGIEKDGMRLYTIEPSVDGTHHVLALDFSASGDDLWFGISRQGFGNELEFPSPWKNFLDRLNEAANSALLRITATRELQLVSVAQAQYQGLATSLVTAGTMSHQLSNFAKNFSSGMATLAEALGGENLQANETLSRLILSLKRSTSELSSILEPLMSITDFDEERPCDLMRAIERCSQLYESWLQQSDIVLTVARPPGDIPLMVDVPFHVVALAISNLISNSIAAIESGGEIRITIIEYEQEIRCVVSDTGPGIPTKVGERVFDLGYSTKPKSGGWGLYLTHRSLIESGASIELTNLEGAEFTIHLPKPPKGNIK